MSEIENYLCKLPTTVRIGFASSKTGEVNTETGLPAVERVSVTLEFSESGFGFGEVTFVQTEDGLFIDTEMMSLERVKKYLSLLVDTAISDTDNDPERHRRYNIAMDQTCSTHCVICKTQKD